MVTPIRSLPSVREPHSPFSINSAMDFRTRLQKATERGQRTRDAKDEKRRAAELSEEETRRLYSGYRQSLVDHIESCLKQLAENFPGFRFEAVVDESGWGGAVSRDDLAVSKGRRHNLFSRLKLVIAPFNKYHVLDHSAKGTVRNKESLARNHFEGIDEIDEDSFHELIELWVLEYAELFAAQT
jgi:hypothetical protein